MKYTRIMMLLVMFLMVFGACAQGAAKPDDFLSRKGAKLYMHGREYRAVGVNVPHLHQAYIGTWLHIPQKYGTNEKARQAIVDSILDAQKSRIAFIRFFASPGYPRDIEMSYSKDKEAYWKTMDELVALCRDHNVKLVPSLNVVMWHSIDNFDEPRQAILDPNSKTYKAAYGYIREFVTRYKDDTTILMWELLNEGMLASDVDMKDSKGLPRECYPADWTREQKTLTREDSFTWAMWLRIYKEQTAFIKSLDPNHLVTSGDAGTRQECTSRRETFPDFKYWNDTLRESIANNLASQPEPLDVYSYHIYGSNKKPEEMLNWMRQISRATHATESPVFIGELGQWDPAFDKDPQGKWARQAIDLMEKEQVSLAALWVWHFNWQPDLTFTSESQPELVKRAGKFNKKWAGLR